MSCFLFHLYSHYHINFTFLRISSRLETISLKDWGKPGSQHAKCSLPVSVCDSKPEVMLQVGIIYFDEGENQST